MNYQNQMSPETQLRRNVAALCGVIACFISLMSCGCLFWMWKIFLLLTCDSTTHHAYKGVGGEIFIEVSYDHCFPDTTAQAAPVPAPAEERR